MENFFKNSIIAAAKSDDGFEASINSKVSLVFDLNPDLLTLADKVKRCHEKGKKYFVHLDLASGIGKDKSGILFTKAAGVDGIISTRVNIIRMAREEKLFTVQRFFLVDSHSIQTTSDAIKSSKPDMIEIMPGVAPKIIKYLNEKLEVPIIAGGLIDSEDEIKAAFESGATAVSTGKKELWD